MPSLEFFVSRCLLRSHEVTVNLNLHSRIVFFLPIDFCSLQLSFTSSECHSEGYLRAANRSNTFYEAISAILWQARNLFFGYLVDYNAPSKKNKIYGECASLKSICKISVKVKPINSTRALELGQNFCVFKEPLEAHVQEPH